MNTKVLIAVGAVALAASVGSVAYYLWPEPIPAFQVKNAQGEAVAFDDLFEGKDYMLVIFLLPNCQVSTFATGVVNEQYAKYGDRMSFVGLVFGDTGTAQKYGEEHAIDFPVYGLRDTPDPFAVNELIHVVGSAHGMGSAVWGGTVLVVDRDGNVEFQLEKEDIKELPKRLGE